MKQNYLRKKMKISQEGILVRLNYNNEMMRGNYCPKFIIGGKENMPYIKHIQGFTYNPNEKATRFDYMNYFLWRFLGKSAYILAWWLRDATRQYLHYLDGTGTVRIIDYSIAYKEDRIIRKHINSKIRQMVNFAQLEFYKSEKNQFEFVGGIEKFPNGNTENWQKTIGSHFAYGHGKVHFNSKTNTATMLITVFAEDMYNFHPGRSDIASHIPDIVNGRFAILGWAKEFLTVGEIHFLVSWDFVNKYRILTVRLCENMFEWQML